MRMIGVLLLFAWAGRQSPADSPLVRGTVLECDARAAGEISIRAAGMMIRYGSIQDLRRARRTAVEASRLKPGRSSALRRLPAYPRAIDDDSRHSASTDAGAGRWGYRGYNPAAEPVLPAGNITYSGVVSRLNGERVLLHTREAGDFSILLRKDTRFLEDGQQVDAERLKPMMRVFVRAGKDVYQQVEAYQVIWGTILKPK